MTESRGHYIQGRWQPGQGTPLQSHDPATDELLWSGREATQGEVDAAVNAAREAFVDWKKLNLAARIAYLEAFHKVLDKAKEKVATTISQETGKPLWESKGEVASMIGKIAISIEAYGVRCPETSKQQATNRLITRHRPHGVMAVVGPFNFPGHLPNGHIIPALLAGNTVVFKSSELTPLVAQVMLECWEEVELPPGVINMVQGGRNTGRILSEHKGIDGLLFTGSWPTGRALAQQMAPTPYKILALEMGGNNPLIVSHVKDIDAAAYIALQSAFLTSGQRCTCARRLIVPQGREGDQLLERLVDLAKGVQIGPYTMSPEPFMGPVIHAKVAETILNKQKHFLEQGAKSLLAARPLPIGKAFISPGIIDVTAVPDRPDEEIFGPLLQVVRVADFAEALEEANNTHYGLIAGLLSDRPQEYERFYQTVQAGLLNWNAPTTGASSAAPFGGIKHSGNHRPSAFYSADYCAYPVASMEATQVHMPATLLPGIPKKSNH